MRRLTLSFTALALATGGVLAAAGPAAAAACTDQVCAFEGRNGTGTVAGFTTADNNFSNNRFLDGTAVNDRISSVSCTSSGQPLFYTNSYWRGNAHRIIPNTGPNNLAWDNQMSSFRFALT
jgi:hypothetical protein